MNKIEYGELIAFHPGYYVKDYMDEQGISLEELARRMRMAPQRVNNIVEGNINLTKEMILCLSNVFGTSQILWENLNQKYMETRAEIEERMHIPVSVGSLAVG